MKNDYCPRQPDKCMDKGIERERNLGKYIENSFYLINFG